LTYSGETNVQALAAVEPETPKLSIDYGRASLVSVADRGTRIRLDLAGRSGTAILGDAQSALAIEVLPCLPLGSDPLATPLHVVVRLYATSGQVSWDEGTGVVSPFGAGQALILVDDSPARLIDSGPLPEWIEGRDISDVDRTASDELEKHLGTDRPLSLSLREAVEHRRVEVRALACRALCCLDFFEPTLEALDDKRYRAYWHAHYDALRFAAARNRDSASKLRGAFDALWGDIAERLFRMMWAYSPEQLESGGAAELVELLEGEAMIARVLAIENLRRITGMTQLFYPETPPDRQKRKIVKWRQALAEGQIRYKTPPSPIPGIPAEKEAVVPKPGDSESP
jgi:hypothetical protein